ncbi:MAG: hypothetical protein CBB97_20860 [Candidatus Endolissoclinum sp. TMED37]|nr:MAG: hypothetical protein CBB97_20860 [Candidatus Endolissoclinum sp. TMED37]
MRTELARLFRITYIQLKMLNKIPTHLAEYGKRCALGLKACERQLERGKRKGPHKAGPDRWIIS